VSKQSENAKQYYKLSYNCCNCWYCNFLERANVGFIRLFFFWPNCSRNRKSN